MAFTATKGSPMRLTHGLPKALCFRIRSGVSEVRSRYADGTLRTQGLSQCGYMCDIQNRTLDANSASRNQIKDQERSRNDSTSARSKEMT